MTTEKLDNFVADRQKIITKKTNNMTTLQIDSTKIIDTSGFWDNYFWPGLLVLTIFALGLIWNFFIRKRVKSKIIFNESFIGQLYGTDYTILKVIINNKTTTPINNLRFDTLPHYDLKKELTKTTQGHRDISGGVDTIIFPMVYDAIENVIDPTVQQKVDAEHPLDGFIVINNTNRNNQIQKLMVSYWDKKIELNINYDNLQVRQL